MPWRPTTAKVSAASKRNIKKAQISRVRTKEPRSVGRAMAKRLMGRVVRRR